MTGSHRAGVDGLLVQRRSPVHDLAAVAKLTGLVLFVVLVALTPRRAVGAFVLDAAVLSTVVAVARIPVRVLASRLVVIAPFVLGALAIPLVAHAPAGSAMVQVAGHELSVDALWATWNIVVKATLGAAAAIVLTATTAIPDLLTAMARLRIPPVLVAVVSSMLRYMDTLADQLGRMRRAMTARGHDPRWMWQVGPIASSIGVLFVRSYERGERVHLAMAARGGTGRSMVDESRAARPEEWLAALTPALVALAGLVTWWVLR